ncbi:MAG: hypothetical protein U0166_10905 [Acidobacteriota bacterium]
MLTPVTPTGLSFTQAELWPDRVLPCEQDTVAEDLLADATLLDRLDGDALWQLRDDGANPTRLAFYSTITKEGWDARRTNRKEGFDMPGACVAYRNVNYEIRNRLWNKEAEVPGWVYILSPWPDASPIRRILVLDEDRHKAERGAQRKAARERAFVYPALLLSYPLLGMLPIERQVAIGNRYGMSPRVMTLISGMFGFGIGGALVASNTGIVNPALFLGIALMIEGLVRFHQGWKAEEPMAFFPVWFLVRTWDAFAHERARRERKRLGYPDALGSRRRAKLANQLDLITPTDDGGFLVKSFTPKVWNDGITVHYRQKYYTAEKRAEEESAEGRMFVYALVPASIADVFRTVTEFRPDDALRDLEEVEREAKGDRFLIGAPIVGLFPARFQLRWVAAGHLPLRAVQHSAFMVALFAATNIYIGHANPSDFPALDAAIAAFSGYLILESIVRFVRAVKGDVTGSILGWPLALLTKLRR